MIYKLLPLIILFATVCNCPILPKNKNAIANEESFRKQIEDVDCDNKDRIEEVQKLFSEVGAKSSEIEVEEFERADNVVVTLKGKTDEIVVVGAHYDKTTLGCGVIDNWSGIVIIANLYKALKNKKNKKTYKFVAFGEEEKGLFGSKAMVENILRRERKNYCAMVNFDSFGFEDAWTFERISDSDLISLAKEAADQRDFVFKEKNFKGASSDSESFLHKNIPAITISGIDDNWRDYLHQEGDKLENMDIDKVYENYLFFVDYLNAIDKKTCDYFR